jgi:hypothetical protein
MATSRRRLLQGAALAGAGAWLRPWRLFARALPQAMPAAPIVEVEVQAVTPRTVRLLLRRAAGAEPDDDGALEGRRQDRA